MSLIYTDKTKAMLLLWIFFFFFRFCSFHHAFVYAKFLFFLNHNPALYRFKQQNLPACKQALTPGSVIYFNLLCFHFFHTCCGMIYHDMYN
jgi:hypothetical protein